MTQGRFIVDSYAAIQECVARCKKILDVFGIPLLGCLKLWAIYSTLQNRYSPAGGKVSWNQAINIHLPIQYECRMGLSRGEWEQGYCCGSLTHLTIMDSSHHY